MEDLQSVAIAEQGVGVKRPGHDHQIALDGDHEGLQPDVSEQVPNAQGSGEDALLAVYGEAERGSLGNACHSSVVLYVDCATPQDTGRGTIARDKHVKLSISNRTGIGSFFSLDA